MSGADENGKGRHRRRVNRARVLILLVLLALPSGGPTLAAVAGGDAPTPTLAVVETDKELSPLAALLTAQLSQEGVKLVERKQLDAVLQEQALSAAGLTDRATLVKVGALVRADAFVLLSLQKGEAKDAPALLHVRVAETAHGVRLLDTFEAWDPRKADEAAGAMAGRLKGVVEKLKLPADQVFAVGIMDVGGGIPGQQFGEFGRDLKIALSVRLSVEPRLVVLERDDLDLLMQEKELTRGEHGGFRDSAVLIDGLLRPAGPRAGQLLLIAREGSGKERWSVTLMVSPTDPVGAAQEAAEKLIPKLTNAPPAGAWDPQQEAAEFYRKGASMWSPIRPAEALPALEAAHALAPQNGEYAARMHYVACSLHLRTGDAEGADAELAALGKCVAPVLEASDVDKLLSLSRWMTASLALFPLNHYDKEVAVAGRYYGLLKRLLAGLKAHVDKPEVERQAVLVEQDMNAMVDGFRARLWELERQRDALKGQGRSEDAGPLERTISRYLGAFEVLRPAPAMAGLHVRILLTGKEWPLAWQWGDWPPLPHARVQCRDGLIWLAITDVIEGGSRRPLGLAALDPKAAAPLACWQAAPSIKGQYSVTLRGVVLGRDHSYVALDRVGVVEFPGTDARGQRALDSPHVLGEKDGLPPGPVTAIAGEPEKMWVGFGDRRTETGLGLYDSGTGRWRTLLSARPLSGGSPPPGGWYQFTEVILGRDLVLLYGEANHDHGLWGLDPQSGKLQKLASFGEVSQGFATEDDVWLQGSDALVHVDMHNRLFALAVSDSASEVRARGGPPAWPTQVATFGPVADKNQVGLLTWGRIDLSTAAIHGDQLWARCGKTQIAILQRGQRPEDARKINNDILDGDPVLQFFDTPYGLLAVGQGSAGIVETGDGK